MPQQPTYATLEDTTPGTEPVSLELAAALVRVTTRNAIYETRDDGAPADPRLFSAMRTAVLLQLEWVEETTGGSASGAAPSQLGSLRFDATETTSSTGADVPEGVAPFAYRILQDAGLIPNRVQVV